jgi:hypothetical protein
MPAEHDALQGVNHELLPQHHAVAKVDSAKLAAGQRLNIGLGGIHLGGAPLELLHIGYAVGGDPASPPHIAVGGTQGIEHRGEFAERALVPQDRHPPGLVDRLGRPLDKPLTAPHGQQVRVPLQQCNTRVAHPELCHSCSIVGHIIIIIIIIIITGRSIIAAGSITRRHIVNTTNTTNSILIE